MPVEMWMVDLAIGVGTIIFGYGLFKGKVNALEESMAKHNEEDSVFHTDLERRLNAQFKRIDELHTKVLLTQAEANKHVDLPTIEEKFVSKRELELQLKNIDLELNYIAKTGTETAGKLDVLIDVVNKLVKDS